jgi:hypothetical protein
MQKYKIGENENNISVAYKKGLAKEVIEELQLAPSKIIGLENSIYMAGDCGSCPSCACIEADFQVLAVIEAPATVPLLVIVGGMSFTS